MGTTDLPLTAADLGIDVDLSGCDVDDLVFCGTPELTAPGSVTIDHLATLAVERGWVGLEAFTGSATTIDDAVRGNLSAFGWSVADVVTSVRTWDRSADRQRTFAASECAFTDGSSRLAERLPDGRHRYEILDVRLLLKQGDLTQPVLDAELAGLLGVAPGSRVPLGAVRDAVGQVDRAC